MMGIPASWLGVLMAPREDAQDIVLHYSDRGVVTIANKCYIVFCPKNHAPLIYLRMPTFGLNQVQFADLVVQSIEHFEVDDDERLTMADVPTLDELHATARSSATKEHIVGLYENHGFFGWHISSDILKRRNA